MCGIAGIIHARGQASPVELNELKHMSALIKGRGPDAEGIWISEDARVGLVNRRLATQDSRSIANQPQFSFDKRVVCIMNGEVYNHRQMRAQLESKGCTFQTNNDTEVVANGYRVWGEGVLERVKGQFAFIAYDTLTGMLLVARDRMGICPLYYTIHEGCLLFASTVEAFLSSMNGTPAVDVQASYDYFVMGAAAGNRTLYEGVRSLRSGHYFYFQVGENPILKRYHSLTAERFEVDEGRSEEQWIDSIRQLFLEGVESCMLGDKEVGLYLSGGIDSVSVMAAVRHLFPERTVKGFSANFLHCLTGIPQGEAEAAAEAADLYGVEHHIIHVSPDDIADNVGVYDLPPDSILNTVIGKLARRASECGVNVALSGEGSDELFFGYDHHHAVVRALHPELDAMLGRYELRGRYAATLDIGKIKLTDVFRIGGTDIDLDDDSVFFSRRSEVRSARQFADGLLNEMLEVAPQAATDQQLMYLDHSHKLPECFLRRAEGTSMNIGVEMRFPFLWDNLVQLMYQLPLTKRIGANGMKRLLRKAMEPFVSESLRSRPKSPFGLPSSRSQYFAGSHAKFQTPAFQHFFWQRYDRVAEAVLQGSYRREGLLDDDYVQALLRPQKSQETCSFNVPLWKLWNFAEWYENWIVK